MSIQTPSTVRQVKQAGARAERTKTFETLARAGFVSRGVIYGIIGILAVKLAIGSGGKTTSQSGALKTIAHQPFGKVLLIIVAIGLAGYALWRFARALLGQGPEGSDSGFDRVAAFASGVAYAVMCAIAVEILLGSEATSAGGAKRPTAGVLGWPGGTWIVGIAGAALCGVAFYQGYRGITHDFLKDSKTEEMSPGVRRWITRIGTVGHLSRMVVFGLVGIFLLKAAIDFNPNKAVEVDGALAKLANHAYGSYLLGIVAAGLVAFAVYSLSDARYRRI
jgi:hypothetical protein